MRLVLVDAGMSSDLLFHALSAEHAALMQTQQLGKQPRQEGTLPEQTDQAPVYFDRVWLDGAGTRRSLRLRPDAIAAYEARKAALTANDVVLVTGGAKGITMECALALGKDTGTRLALVGSSPAAAVSAALQRFRDAGIVAHYFQCDLNSQVQVRALVTEVRATLGAIVGLVHGAGLNHPRPLSQSTPEQGLAEMAPKLLGGGALLDALEETPPKLVVMFSSVIGVIGMMGNTWYALANECLDLKLGAFLARHPETEGVSLAYTVWEGTGMGVHLGALEALRGMGVDTLAIAEGIKHFMCCVKRAPAARQVVISGRLAHLETWRPSQPAADAETLLGKAKPGSIHGRCLSLLPGVEAVLEYDLDYDTQDFLHDHVFAGSCLLATTVLMEMFAQAAQVALGAPLALPLSFENLAFSQAITIPVHGQRQVRIRAVVAETLADNRAQAQANPHIKLEARSGADRFRRVWAAATLQQLPARDALEAAPAMGHAAMGHNLDLDWSPASRGVYDSVLFHGPSYQRLSRVQQLDEQQSRCRVRVSPQTHQVLGDHAARDACLQSMQLALTPKLALPKSFVSWRIWGQPRAGIREITAISTLLATEDRCTSIKTTVFSPEDACLLEEVVWEAEHVSPNSPQTTALPTVSELNRGWSADAARIRGALEGLSVAKMSQPAAIFTQRVADIHALTVSERHELHRAFLRQVLGKQIHVDWDERGAPSLLGTLTGYDCLSISHVDGLCLYVLANSNIGCDLVAVDALSEARWPAVLPAFLRQKVSALSKSCSVSQSSAILWAVQEAAFKSSKGDFADPQCDDLLCSTTQSPPFGTVAVSTRDHRIEITFLILELRGTAYALAFASAQPQRRESGVYARTGRSGEHDNQNASASSITQQARTFSKMQSQFTALWYHKSRYLGTMDSQGMGINPA